MTESGGRKSSRIGSDHCRCDVSRPVLDPPLVEGTSKSGIGGTAERRTREPHLVSIGLIARIHGEVSVTRIGEVLLRQLDMAVIVARKPTMNGSGVQDDTRCATDVVHSVRHILAEEHGRCIRTCYCHTVAGERRCAAVGA